MLGAEKCRCLARARDPDRPCWRSQRLALMMATAIVLFILKVQQTSGLELGTELCQEEPGHCR